MEGAGESWPDERLEHPLASGPACWRLEGGRRSSSRCRCRGGRGLKGDPLSVRSRPSSLAPRSPTAGLHQEPSPPARPGPVRPRPRCPRPRGSPASRGTPTPQTVARRLKPLPKMPQDFLLTFRPRIMYIRILTGAAVATRVRCHPKSPSPGPALNPRARLPTIHCQAKTLTIRGATHPCPPHLSPAPGPRLRSPFLPTTNLLPQPFTTALNPHTPLRTSTLEPKVVENLRPRPRCETTSHHALTDTPVCQVNRNTPVPRFASAGGTPLTPNFQPDHRPLKADG